MNLFTKLASEALSISIVSYAVNISMAKLFAKKHNYEINPDQVNIIKSIKFLLFYNYI
jgi:hypothetical protein